jgi:hypothetical protein
MSSASGRAKGLRSFVAEDQRMEKRSGNSGRDRVSIPFRNNAGSNDKACRILNRNAWVLSRPAVAGRESNLGSTIFPRSSRTRLVSELSKEPGSCRVCGITLKDFSELFARDVNLRRLNQVSLHPGDQRHFQNAPGYEGHATSSQ